MYKIRITDTDDRWIPLTKGQWCRTRADVMTTSWLSLTTAVGSVDNNDRPDRVALPQVHRPVSVTGVVGMYTGAGTIIGITITINSFLGALPFVLPSWTTQCDILWNKWNCGFYLLIWLVKGTGNREHLLLINSSLGVIYNAKKCMHRLVQCTKKWKMFQRS